VIARLAKLGFLADFISRTVLIGFLTGVGIQVAIGQLSGLLGIPKPQLSGFQISGNLKSAWDVLSDIGHASGATVAVSASVLVVLIVFERFIPAVPGGLVAVIGSIAVSYYADLASHGVSTLGPVPSGLPSIGLPSGVGLDQVPGLFATCASMFLVIIAQSAATSRAYAVKYTERFEENTDIVGLAVANLSAGVSGTFVVNGSPTKTEMVDEAKSRTQIAQLTTGVVVALVLLFLAGPLKYLPNAVLAAVVFLIGLKLVNLLGMREIWAQRRGEFWIAAVTAFVVVVVGVEQGIVLAMVLSILLHVSRHYKPRDAVLTWDGRGFLHEVPPLPGATSEPGLVLYRFAVGIFFANATRLSDQVLALASATPRPRWVVLVADGVDDVDFTGGHVLLELAAQLEERGVVFALAELEPDVRAELERNGMIDKIGAEHVFETREAARDAFRAAPA
jgi:MFS superfamily sulfate permease-like transporter